MLKLDKGKKIMAIVFSSALVFSGTAFANENSISSYIEDGELSICDYGYYEVKINEDEVDRLIEEGKGLSIEIGDVSIEIDSMELSKIKENSLEQQRELNNYKAIIYTTFGVVVLLVVKTELKKMIKK